MNWLVFITEMKSVYSAVRTGSLNKAVCSSFLKGYYLNLWIANKGLCTEWQEASTTTKIHADGSITERDRKRMELNPYDEHKIGTFVLVIMEENRGYEIPYCFEHTPDGMCPFVVWTLQSSTNYRGFLDRNHQPWPSAGHHLSNSCCQASDMTFAQAYHNRKTTEI